MSPRSIISGLDLNMPVAIAELTIALTSFSSFGEKSTDAGDVCWWERESVGIKFHEGLNISP